MPVHEFLLSFLVRKHHFGSVDDDDMIRSQGGEQRWACVFRVALVLLQSPYGQAPGFLRQR